MCRTGDTASTNVLGKLDMRPEGTAQDPVHGNDLRVFGIDLTEFQG